MANVLNSEKRAQMAHCLVEGMSVRATARLCGVAFNTVLKFVRSVWSDVEDEFPDKSTEFLIEMTVQRVRISHGFKIDAANVVEALKS